MEYAFYALVIAVSALLAVLGISLKNHIDNQRKAGNSGRTGAKRHTRQTASGPARRVNLAASRHGFARGASLSDVQTPWGWPKHHAHGRLEMSESLHHFADRLLQQKTRSDSNDYLRRKNECIRALLEDRYGRVIHDPRSGDVGSSGDEAKGRRVTTH